MPKRFWVWASRRRSSAARAGRANTATDRSSISTSRRRVRMPGAGSTQAWRARSGLVRARVTPTPCAPMPDELDGRFLRGIDPREGGGIGSRRICSAPTPTWHSPICRSRARETRGIEITDLRIQFVIRKTAKKGYAYLEIGRLEPPPSDSRYRQASSAARRSVAEHMQRGPRVGPDHAHQSPCSRIELAAPLFPVPQCCYRDPDSRGELALRHIELGSHGSNRDIRTRSINRLLGLSRRLARSGSHPAAC